MERSRWVMETSYVVVSISVTSNMFLTGLGASNRFAIIRRSTTCSFVDRST